MKGIFTGYQGRTERAIDLVGQGLAAVDEQRDPSLVLSALQSRAWFLVDCGRFRDARLAGLELGALWLRQGRFEETVALVLECTGVFVSLKIEREAGVAVMVVERAAELRTLTLALLEHAIESLQKVERGPYGRL